MAKRIIYQTLPRLWGNGKFSDWDDASLGYLRSLGVDYVWYTGVPRHATGKDFVKGDPGSPYAISDWRDVNPYLADDPAHRLEEFDALLARTHAAGMRVLIDYIPNHVAPDYEGRICRFDWCDGDWTDTRKNDWSSPETRAEMLEILRFWAMRGVDGFRCDMVELVPPEALKALISAVKADFPGLLFVAEVYQKDNYRRYLDDVGFDLLYDKSGLYDTLRAICCHGASARGITWNWQWLGDLQPRVLNFLENHDEQRLAAPEFLGAAEKGYAALACSLLFNTAPFMLYFGQEVGEDGVEGADGRTSIFNWSDPAELRELYRSLHGEAELAPAEAAVLARYRELLSFAWRPAFAEGGTWDLMYCNEGAPGFHPDRHFAFVRYAADEAWLVVCNFSDTPATVRISLPPELRDACPVLPDYTTAYASATVPAWDAAIVKLA
jgi:glycosidase